MTRSPRKHWFKVWPYKIRTSERCRRLTTSQRQLWLDLLLHANIEPPYGVLASGPHAWTLDEIREELGYSPRRASRFRRDWEHLTSPKCGLVRRREDGAWYLWHFDELQKPPEDKGGQGEGDGQPAPPRRKKAAPILPGPGTRAAPNRERGLGGSEMC